MSILTYFIAPLRCPSCGAESKAEMQDKLLDGEGDKAIHLGDRVDAALEDFADTFLTIHPPEDGELVRIIHDWECGQYHTLEWALLTIEDHVFRRAEARILSKRLLDEAHFLDETIYDYFQEITGEPLLANGAIRPDFLQVLRSKLPDDG